MANPDNSMTLDQAVAEVLATLNGLDLRYEPNQSTYLYAARQINKALRSNARDHEWSYYSEMEHVGTAVAGQQDYYLRGTVRPRLVGDDAVILEKDGTPLVWAYYLPRNADEKYFARQGLWATVTKQTLHFTRKLNSREDGADIRIPVMREPRLFVLPDQPDDPNADLIEVPQTTRDQLVDFSDPDLIVERAAYHYSLTDPVLQPQSQTFENIYKNTMYALTERDQRHTDAPYMNSFFVPIQNGIDGPPDSMAHRHPHADERTR